MLDRVDLRGKQYKKRAVGCEVVAIVYLVLGFFFFQAEDGIRDVAVTGVQTCALPISRSTLYLRLQNSCCTRATLATSRNLKSSIPSIRFSRAQSPRTCSMSRASTTC